MVLYYWLCLRYWLGWGERLGAEIFLKDGVLSFHVIFTYSVLISSFQDDPLFSCTVHDGKR
jgi:hypothetical protein